METFPSEVSKELLSNDFKSVVADAEALVKATTNMGGEKLAEVRAKAEETLNMAKARMAEAQEALVEKTKAAAHATDEYVHENPWKAVGVGVGTSLVIGFLVGLIIGRR